MDSGKLTEQQAASSLKSPDATIERLLRERARGRAAPLRWNVQSVVLSYSVLAAVVIMSLQEVRLLITVLVAVLGLGLVWFSSWLRLKKFENVFYQEEADNYAKMVSAQPSQEPARAAPNNLSRRAESPLTARETTVLEQVMTGKSSKEIARALEISPQTVKNHMSHVFSKLGVTDRTSAVPVALRHGWVKHDDEEP